MLSEEMKAQGWKDMTDAPRDMKPFAVCFHEWNVATNPLKYQFAQYWPPRDCFIAPWNPDSEVYAVAWMTLEEFSAYRPETPNA